MISVSPCCPRCQAGYLPGALACARCRYPLESVAAEPVALAELPELNPHGARPQWQTAFVLELEGEEEVKLHGRPARRVEVGVEPLTIGRRDPRSGSFPDVDLRGVRDFGYTSRQHARVYQADGRLFVVDLKGLDTTAINAPGRTLPAHQPVELVDGDRLIIGEAVTFRVVHQNR